MEKTSPRQTSILHLLAAFLILLLPLAGFAHAAFAQAAQPNNFGAITTASGTVTDAVSGAPIFRALVRLGQRAVLTDAQGHFSFPAVDTAQLNITVSKPGYTFTRNNEPSDIGLKSEDLADPIVLHLYPEAILKGTITNSSGDPIPNVAVNASRIFNDVGRYAIKTGVTRSNVHGQFRISVPAGEYRVESEYTELSPTSAILPTSLPPPSELHSQQSITVNPGDQLTVDLHPAIVPLVQVLARIDSPNPHELSTLTANLPSGASIPLPFKDAGPSEIRVSLPTGAYTVSGYRRSFGADTIEEAPVNVASSQSNTLTLHFAPVAAIPIEVAIDDASLAAASTSGQTLTTPHPFSLNLTLEATASTSNPEGVRPSQHHPDDISFTAPSGSYRLRARAARSWYIVSATFGGTDLLSHELLVTSGAASTPIQLTVSNQAASLKGAITLNGKPASCWIYLLATTPTATPIIALHSGQDGSYNDTFIPPGSYRAIAFEQRHPLDPYDPEALAPFTPAVRSISIEVGDKATLDLEAIPAADRQP